MMSPLNLIKSSITNKFLNKNCIFRVFYSSKSPGLPQNALKDTISADGQSGNGIVYDKKPFRMTLEAGKRYSWCLCGHSNSQPFCDGTHKQQQLKITLKPVKLMVTETKEYWLCNCKATKNRPFCDGTHKSPTIQEGNSRVRT